MTKLHTRGFTIIELLIATIVSSIMILSILIVFIQITRYFTKGTTQVNTQKATRQAIDSITQEIQTTTGGVELPFQPSIGSPYMIFCINHRRYSYKVIPSLSSAADLNDWQDRALYVEDDLGSDVGASQTACVNGGGSNTGPKVFNPTARGKDLLGENMLIVSLILKDADGGGKQARLYRVALSVLNAPADAQASRIITVNSSSVPLCQGAAVKGSEYCGLSTLDTTIFRLNKVNY